MNDKAVEFDILIRMRDRMYTRGPDDSGIWIDGPVGLGHRRLSILDLSSLGQQPMVDEEYRTVISYNGEVYNFRELRQELERQGVRFRSNTDTEVILQAYIAWGKACVERFIGMFALAIWDARRQVMFLARDRLGIKPLYYFVNNNMLIFASRLGALLAHPECSREIDAEGLSLYLQMGFVPAPWSILKGVRKLRPGHTLYVDRNGLKEHCYWSIDNIELDETLVTKCNAELEEQLDELLRDSIKLRLISDVPIGAFLSGGIDSSTVVAIMQQVANSQVKTFTIGFTENQYDESRYARKIAKHLGTQRHESIFGTNDLLGYIEDMTKHYDEPFADWSSLPTMMLSRFARQYVTVCLSGDGGDELFAGYHYYKHMRRITKFHRLPKQIRKLASILLSKSGKHSYMLGAAALREDSWLGAFAFMRSMAKDYSRDVLFQPRGFTLRDLFSERLNCFPTLDPISAVTRLDTAYYLADDILQKVDVASMSVGLEARVPILDHRIVEFAHSLPMKFKNRHGVSKWLLRRVLSRYIPQNLFDRPKRGFEVPIREWFRGELKAMIQDELAPGRIGRIGLIDSKNVQHILNLHLSGKRDTHPILWALLSLLRWYDYFIHNSQK